MRPFALTLSAALLACLPRPTPAVGEAEARSGPYLLQVVDQGGRPLPTFWHRGRTYVLGRLGKRYLLRVRNDSWRRIEVVGSVDGRDVVDGRPASLGKRGYLVEPYGELTIDGFRLSQESVAAFRFSTVARSYAARVGDARDVGVIGLAVFPERAQAWRPPPPWPMGRGRDRDDAPAGVSPGMSSEGRGAAEAQAAPAPGDAARADARAERRPGLGTEFGEEHGSHVEHVAFERASNRPEALLTVRYDDRSGLAALGIDLDGRLAGRDEAWRRETARPFPASPGYSAPPPGWRP
jgi:hypothetical protein